jgi:CRISPR system Cascade subunit CasA
VILFEVVSHYDCAGNVSPMKGQNDAIERWSIVWSKGLLPIQSLEDYFERWHDRFFLFHPEYPFYQNLNRNGSRESFISAEKMSSVISKSGNKERWFATRRLADEEPGRLSFSEAARWLVHFVSFDDASQKVKKGIGVGWLGKIGPVYLQGKSLFETLMLNLTLLRDGRYQWDEGVPLWEADEWAPYEDTVDTESLTLVELYTAPCRSVWLKRDGDFVTGCQLVGGVSIDIANQFAEQMTLWDASKKEDGVYTPRKLEPSRQLWRDVPYIITSDSVHRQPGILAWLTTLKQKRILNRDFPIVLCSVGVKYDSKNSSIDEVFGDSICIDSSLFASVGSRWRRILNNEIRRIDGIAESVAELANSVDIAKRGRPNAMSKPARVLREMCERKGRESFYSSIDEPFKDWIACCSGKQSAEQRDGMIKTWRDKSKAIAKTCAQSIVDEGGLPAFIGHEWKDDDGKKQYYSSANALNIFYDSLRKY